MANVRINLILVSVILDGKDIYAINLFASMYYCSKNRLVIKHEYLRSRSSKCLSLSSTSPSPVVSQIMHITPLWLSRYSCLYLGSRIHEFLNKGFISFYKETLNFSVPLVKMVFAQKETMEMQIFAFAKMAGKANLAINVYHFGVAQFKIKQLA